MKPAGRLATDKHVTDLSVKVGKHNSFPQRSNFSPVLQNVTFHCLYIREVLKVTLLR